MKFDKGTKIFGIIIMIGWMLIGFATLLNTDNVVVIMIFVNAMINIIIWLSIVHLIKNP